MSKRKSRSKPWSVVQASSNVHVVHLSVGRGKTLRTLHISDVHFDNPKCNRALLKKHLDEALEHEAIIFCYGDWFCAMQGKGDPRAGKEDIRPENQTVRYLDSLVDTSFEFLRPYKENLALLTYGNHETKVIEYRETDLIDRLTYKLRGDGGITYSGGYSGWVRFQNTLPRTEQRSSLRLRYHHGFGGGGRASKGIMQFRSYLEDARADMYVSGHVHYSNHHRDCQQILSDSNRIEDRPIDFVRCGTYKNDWGTGKAGWPVEKNLGPRNLGGYWCEFDAVDKKLSAHWEATKGR